MKKLLSLLIQTLKLLYLRPEGAESSLMVRLAFVSQCTEDGLGCVHYFADSGSQE